VTEQPKQNADKAPRRKAAQPLPISARRVKALAFQCATLVAAADPKVVGDRVDLVAAIEQHEALRKAWERGEFLRRFRELAATCVDVTELGRELKLEPRADAGKLVRDMIAADREVRQIWQQVRYELRRAVWRGRTAAIEAGDLTNTAINKLERLFRDDEQLSGRMAGELDLEHLSTAAIVQALDISRNTLYEWVTSKACPKNADDTYSLRAVLAWWMRYTEEKLVAKAGRPVMPGGIPTLSQVKISRVLREEAEAMGKLIAKEAFVDHLIGQAQFIANTLSRQTAIELGHAGEGRTAPEVTALVEKVFGDIRHKMTALPEAVRFTPTGREHCEAIMKELSEPKGEEGTSETPRSNAAGAQKAHDDKEI
jgi:hypothetical protein